PVPEGETMMSFLRERTRDGFQQRYGRADAGLKSRAQCQIERELALIESSNYPATFLLSWTWSVSAASRTSWCRGEARLPTALSAIRWESPRSIRSAWGCFSSDFFRKSAESGQIAILTCPAATSANASFNICTNVTASAARP